MLFLINCNFGLDLMFFVLNNKFSLNINVLIVIVNSFFYFFMCFIMESEILGCVRYSYL